MKLKILRNTVIAPGVTALAGSTVTVAEDLDERAARYLVNIKKAKYLEAESADSLTVDQVVDAIHSLDLEDEAVMTSDEKPSTKALEQVLGVKVSASLRDEAWQLYLTDK